MIWSRLIFMVTTSAISTIVIESLDPSVPVKAMAIVLLFWWFGWAHIDYVLTWLEARKASQETPTHDYSLYLRSFRNDRTSVTGESGVGEVPFEDKVFRHMARFAPPYRLLDPKSRIGGTIGARPLLDIKRDDWLEVIKRHTVSDHCKLIVFVPFVKVEDADSEAVAGVVREIMMAFQAAPEKVIVILPPNISNSKTEELKTEIETARKGEKGKNADTGGIDQLLRFLDGFEEKNGGGLAKGQPVKRMYSWRVWNGDSHHWSLEVGNIIEQWAGAASPSALHVVRFGSWLDPLAVMCGLLGYTFSLSSSAQYAVGDAWVPVITACAVLLIMVQVSAERAWHVRAALRYGVVKVPLIKFLAQSVVLAIVLG